MKKSLVILAVSAMSLFGCASTNSYLADRTTTVEMYHIFDIRTSAGTAIVAKAAADGLSQNTNKISSNMPLQLNKAVPTEPGRFTIEDVGAKLGGTGMGTLIQMAAMQNGGVTLKAAKCDEAVWTARAVREISGQSNLTLYGCLFKYKSGYNLNTYAVFQKKEGGVLQIPRDIAGAMVGSPEEWVNKTIVDMVRSIEVKANAKIAYLEGQPEIGNLPWVDRIDTNTKVSKSN